jgi:hypothetical protein
MSKRLSAPPWPAQRVEEVRERACVQAVHALKDADARDDGAPPLRGGVSCPGMTL